MLITVGIDEVGRGSWAGPVVAAAVILGPSIIGLKDSKLLSKQQRDQFALEIDQKATAIGVGWVDAHTIDQIGLTAAVRLAMERALELITSSYQLIIIDGKYNFLAHIPLTKAVVKADMTIDCVSAASIVAKVARDTYMQKQALQYPNYHFDKHVGYGTLRHREVLLRYGPCELHRLSYKPVQLSLAAPKAN